MGRGGREPEKGERWARALGETNDAQAPGGQAPHLARLSTHHPPARFPVDKITLTFPSLSSNQQSNSAGLVVISEEDTRTLLIHRLCPDDIYQRQGGERSVWWWGGWCVQRE